MQLCGVVWLAHRSVLSGLIVPETETKESCMLRWLTMEKIHCILDAADRGSETTYPRGAFDGGGYSAFQDAAPLQAGGSCVASCESMELVATLNTLTREEQAELAALFYAGRDRVEFYAMMQNGRNIAGRNFGAYLGVKRRFAEHVRAGLEQLGHAVRE